MLQRTLIASPLSMLKPPLELLAALVSFVQKSALQRICTLPSMDHSFSFFLLHVCWQQESTGIWMFSYFLVEWCNELVASCSWYFYFTRCTCTGSETPPKFGCFILSCGVLLRACGELLVVSFFCSLSRAATLLQQANFLILVFRSVLGDFSCIILKQS